MASTAVKKESTGNVALGTHLRRARMKYNVSLRQLGRDGDVSATYLSSIENGQEMPSERILKLYAKKFRLELDELLRVAGKVPSDVKRHLVKTPGAIAKVRNDMKKK